MNYSYVSPSKRYGITERKKSELDALSIKVIDAQYEVDQLQAIVTSLTEKSQNFLGFLAYADTNRAHTLSNRNLLDQVVQNVDSLKGNSEIAYKQMIDADKSTKALAIQVKSLIDKLIYSAEVINKLSNQVIRTKAINPLISDDLIARITAAGTDANNAVALTLIALQATFATQASNLESEAATVLEYMQSIKLQEILTIDPKDISDITGVQKKCLKNLLYDAYSDAESQYTKAQKASIDTTRELNAAIADLNKAQIKLKSLQLGLAAGNAAALAS